jgi:uncharacterized membrane-anchored protein YhcB (DUF1043 family)
VPIAAWVLLIVAVGVGVVIEIVFLRRVKQRSSDLEAS